MTSEAVREVTVPEFGELVDVGALQSMMDDFYDLTHIPTAVIDLNGVVIVGSGWQEVCTRFHRTNPETCANCIESDTVITADIPAGTARLYQCKNGMWDAAMPVVAGDIHIANVFTGQFFFDDTPIDTGFFAKQAKRYGFEEGEYLSAVDSVPRLSHATVDTGLDFLTKLASMISQLGLLALENARLYEAEHKIAETLQDTLVSMPTVVPGVSFSRAYETATSESGRVGGDFVDMFVARDDVVGIALGDVSGKGIDAAVTTSLIRTTLRIHALDGLSPAEIALKANNVLHRFTEAHSFVTLWFGLLSTVDGHLRYISAGHPPALVVSETGQISMLETRDPILGAFENASYFESQTILTKGDRLILYSDGVTEARSPIGSFLGEDGLMEIVRKRHSHATSILSDAIMNDVHAHSDGVLRDDAAILSVESVGLSGR